MTTPFRTIIVKEVKNTVINVFGDMPESEAEEMAITAVRESQPSNKMQVVTADTNPTISAHTMSRFGIREEKPGKSDTRPRGTR